MYDVPRINASKVFGSAYDRKEVKNNLCNAVNVERFSTRTVVSAKVVGLPHPIPKRPELRDRSQQCRRGLTMMTTSKG
jgi:hypothetical protein